jgi:hypothetical protein
MAGLGVIRLCFSQNRGFLSLRCTLEVNLLLSVAYRVKPVWVGLWSGDRPSSPSILGGRPTSATTLGCALEINEPLPVVQFPYSAQ